MCTIDRASFWLYFQNFEKKDVISYQTCKTLFNFKVATMNLKHSVDPSLFFENADIISQLEMFCSDRFTWSTSLHFPSFISAFTTLNQQIIIFIIMIMLASRPFSLHSSPYYIHLSNFMMQSSFFIGFFLNSFVFSVQVCALFSFYFVCGQRIW